MHLLPLAVLGCQPADPPPETSGGDDTAAALPLEHRLSFVVFADPHLTEGAMDHQERLAAAVAWVNAEAEARKIALVVVVGDIGWGGGLPIARVLLDELAVPYAPVIGDNEIHFGDEQTFDDVFADQFALLAQTQEDFRRGAVAVYDPVQARTLWLQNFAFSLEGLRIIGLDWCSRSESDVLSEFAELNIGEEGAEGSLPFLEQEVATLEAGTEENALLFSHHPMHLGAFELVELEQLEAVTMAAPERIAAAFAGHYHVSLEESLQEEAGYDVFVTDAIWDDENTIRVVSVLSDGVRFVYEQELVVVP